MTSYNNIQSLASFISINSYFPLSFLIPLQMQQRTEPAKTRVKATRTQTLSSFPYLSPSANRAECEQNSSELPTTLMLSPSYLVQLSLCSHSCSKLLSVAFLPNMQFEIFLLQSLLPPSVLKKPFLSQGLDGNPPQITLSQESPLQQVLGMHSPSTECHAPLWLEEPSLSTNHLHTNSCSSAFRQKAFLC